MVDVQVCSSLQLNKTVRKAAIEQLAEMFIPFDRRVIIRVKSNGGPKHLRGSCSNMRDISIIDIYADTVDHSVATGHAIGGNMTAAFNTQHGVLLCVAHEIRHVLQYIEGGHPRWDDGLKYSQQPHEVDARDFVDRHYRLITSFTLDPFEQIAERRHYEEYAVSC